jgi:hypothetical protein
MPIDCDSLGAARTVHIFHLSARQLQADERTAKAAIYGLNRAGGRTESIEVEAIGPGRPILQPCWRPERNPYAGSSRPVKTARFFAAIDKEAGRQAEEVTPRQVRLFGA